MSITEASLQFPISAVQLVPVGQLEFTLILYAVLSCLFYCPSEAIIKTRKGVMCSLIAVMNNKNSCKMWAISGIANCMVGLKIWAQSRSWNGNVKFTEEIPVFGCLLPTFAFNFTNDEVRGGYLVFEGRSGEIGTSSPESVCINNVTSFSNIWCSSGVLKLPQQTGTAADALLVRLK